MVLMAILGELGSGKTLALTYLALRNYHKDRSIFANYRLNHIPFTRVKTPEDVLRMREGFAALDELWTWCDSRLSGSHKNKFVTMVLAKSRKRDIHIAYTTQYFKAVDIRIRTVTDFVAIPQLNSRETLCTLKIYSNPAMVLQTVYRFRCQPIWNLYDTKEEVEELDIQDFLQSQKKTKKKQDFDDEEIDDSPIKKKKKKPKPVIYEEDE